MLAILPFSVIGGKKLTSQGKKFSSLGEFLGHPKNFRLEGHKPFSGSRFLGLPPMLGTKEIQSR
jgi:hypothetical protein